MGDKKDSVASPWAHPSTKRVGDLFASFSARIQEPETREKLEELTAIAKVLLGPKAIHVESGVYNPVRLYRILVSSDMDILDAMGVIVLTSNARNDFKLDDKRNRIVNEDLGFDSLPRALEYREFQPVNLYLGRGKVGCGGERGEGREGGRENERAFKPHSREKSSSP